MLTRLLPAALALALLTLPLQAAAAVDYTDIWYLPSESGWGVNFVQANNVIFATFFVYSEGNVPTWYTAIIYGNSDGSNFTGNLYATTGTWFGATWDPSKVVNTLAGTASFTPTNAYQGTLAYSFTTGIPPTVTKLIQRQVLTTIALGGDYVGGIEGGYANSGGTCPAAGGYTDTYNLTLSQPGDGTASFTFNFASGNPANCTLSGTLVQYGQLYAIPNASYQCSDGLSTTASVDQIKATAQGVEGTYFAPSVGSNCSEAATFSAVFLQ